MKNSFSFLEASDIGILLVKSNLDLFLTPTYPNFNGISSFIKAFLASVPASIISNLVNTPKVLEPEVSISLANLSPSEVAISLFAAMTHKIIVKGSSIYLIAIFFVISSIFFGWPSIGTLVTPGKSTKVRSGHVCEYTFNTIGLSKIFLSFPHTSSVKASIVSLTLIKSVNFFPFLSSKTAQGSPVFI